MTIWKKKKKKKKKQKNNKKKFSLIKLCNNFFTFHVPGRQVLFLNCYNLSKSQKPILAFKFGFVNWVLT